MQVSSASTSISRCISKAACSCASGGNRNEFTSRALTVSKSVYRAVNPVPIHIRQRFGQHHLLQRVVRFRAMARQQPPGQQAQGWAPGNADKVKISNPVSVTASECSNWADKLRSLVTVVHLSGNTFTW